MAAPGWDPDRYERFATERERPFWDLAGLLAPVQAPRLADLGCGTGRLTAALAARLGARSALGVDDSAEMLERAAEHASSAAAFAAGDIGAWTAPAGSFDVVFSNAALQWVPDHAGVLARWVGALAPGGQLAVQLPDNRRSAPHRLIAELLPDSGERHSILEIEEYSRILHALGCAETHVRAQVYPSALPDRDAAVEWLRGSRLTEYEARLAPGEFAALLAAFRAGLPDEHPFRLDYVRVLMWARLPTPPASPPRPAPPPNRPPARRRGRAT